MSGENPKERYGKQKPQMALVPAVGVIATAKVMELGARKYGAFNWREKPVSVMTYLHAAQRHLAAFVDGEDKDRGSEESHLAHVAANMMILLDAAEGGMAVDDRPKAGKAGRVLASLTKVAEPMGKLMSWTIWRSEAGNTGIGLWEAWPHDSKGPGAGWSAIGQSHKPTAEEALEEVRVMWRPYT